MSLIIILFLFLDYDLQQSKKETETVLKYHQDNIIIIGISKKILLTYARDSKSFLEKIYRKLTFF